MLDWGGSGRPVVFLAGGGNTAHVFDEFAPKLAPDFHVYGITRRGFGASGFAMPENGADTLGDDVVAVVRALRLLKPVLVGHSIAGAELSAVASSHPDGIADLVYLEAAYPYAFNNGRGPRMQDFQVGAPTAPGPGEGDLASFSALQKWDAGVYGFRTPEAELRQVWEATPSGRVGKMRDFPGSQMFMNILTSAKTYTAIPVPALVIFAIPNVPDKWIAKSGDPAAREYFTRLDALKEKQAGAVQSAVPTARVVRLPGSHYIFLSNEGDVLREMRAFLGGLTRNAGPA